MSKKSLSLVENKCNHRDGDYLMKNVMRVYNTQRELINKSKKLYGKHPSLMDKKLFVKNMVDDINFWEQQLRLTLITMMSIKLGGTLESITFEKDGSISEFNVGVDMDDKENIKLINGLRTFIFNNPIDDILSVYDSFGIKEVC